jgi:hypothetical protein
MNFKIGKNVDVNMSVLNMLGEQVFAAKFSNVTMFSHTFNFSSLPKGIYLVKLNYGSEHSTERLVIQ